MFLLILFCLCLHLTEVLSIECDPFPGTPVNSPFGKPRGVRPGRVSWAWEPKATTWDGKTGFYWEYINQSLVDDMLHSVVSSLSTNSSDPWKDFFVNVNERVYHVSTPRDYVAGDGIAIKVNLNQETQSYDGNNGNHVSPQFLRSLLRQLVNVAGVPQHDIVIYDASRLFLKNYWYPPVGFGSEFPNVRLEDNHGGEPYVTQVQPDPKSYFQFSNASVAYRFETKLPVSVVQSRYMIIVNNFRGHSMAGLTETGKNFFGSIYRPDVYCHWWKINSHWCPSSLHQWIIVSQMPMGSYTVLVDLLGHLDLAGKGVLFLSDGLFGGPQEDHFPVSAVVPPVKFESLGNWWSSSIFGSMDPVALDSVLFDFLRNEPNVPAAHTDKGCIDNYLHEAALADKPRSGTVYNPTGKEQLDSLGIHEHWNNEKDRQYSRNLGRDEGIELFRVDV